MAEERLDVVVDPGPAKRGIDAIIQAYNNMAGAAAKAESATTKLFDTMNSGFKKLESAVLNFRSIILGFGSVIGAFTSLGDQFSRFQSFISAMSVAVGGTKAAREEFDFMMQMADKLGVSVTSLSRNYGQLAAAATMSGMSMKTVRDIFESFATAARVLHLSNQDTSLMFYAVTQMISKGVVSMEELRRQLGEKLPGAMNIAAESVGLFGTKGMKEFEDAVRKGVVNSAKFLQFFHAEVRERFSNGLPNAMRALDAEMNRLSNNWQKMITTMFDLGVADAFTNLIRELNRIMSDKKIAEEFAKAIKSISDGVTEFLRGISGETVRKFVTEFSGGMMAIGNILTQQVLPFMRELLTILKEIIAAWLVIKGAQLGAELGKIGGVKGAAVGGIIGGIAGGVGANYLGNRLDQSIIAANTRQSVTGKIAPREFVDTPGGAMDMGVGTGFLTRRARGTLKDVLQDSDKDKEREAQIKKYEAEILSLSKKEADGGEFTRVMLEINAQKYDKLTEAMRNNLKVRAALADVDRSTDDFNKQIAKDNELRAQERNRDSDERQQRAITRFEELKNQYASEEELLKNAYDREIEIINEAERQKIVTQDTINMYRYFAEDAFLNKLERLRKSKLTALQKWEEMSAKEKTVTVLGELQEIVSGVEQHSRLMFNISKVAAIGMAALKAHEGATRTLGAYPWPLAGILATLHYAAGVARVAAIANTSFGGGGAGSSPSVVGTTSAPPVTPVDISDNQTTNPIERRFVVEIKSRGINREVLEEIATGLNELSKDGFPVLFELETV